ncbi:hypothetical protein WICPIJ_001695, partial [Wickerhamomyces pijperi]
DVRSVSSGFTSRSGGNDSNTGSDWEGRTSIVRTRSNSNDSGFWLVSSSGGSSWWLNFRTSGFGNSQWDVRSVSSGFTSRSGGNDSDTGSDWEGRTSIVRTRSNSNDSGFWIVNSSGGSSWWLNFRTSSTSESSSG